MVRKIRHNLEESSGRPKLKVGFLFACQIERRHVALSPGQRFEDWEPHAGAQAFLVGHICLVNANTYLIDWPGFVGAFLEVPFNHGTTLSSLEFPVSS